MDKVETAATMQRSQPWNPWAISALVCGFLTAVLTLFGMLFFKFLLLFGIVLLISAPAAMALGIISLRTRHRELQGRSFGVLGIVIGGVVTVLLYPAAVILLLVSIVFHGAAG